MTIPSTGALTLAQIRTEFNGPTPVLLSQYYLGAGLVPDIGANSGIPRNGAIRFSHFYNALSSYSVPVADAAFIGTLNIRGTQPVEAESLQLYIPKNYAVGSLRAILWGGGGGGADWFIASTGGGGGELTDILLDDPITHLGYYPRLSTGGGGARGTAGNGVTGGPSLLLPTGVAWTTSAQWYMARGGPGGVFAGVGITNSMAPRSQVTLGGIGTNRSVFYAGGSSPDVSGFVNTGADVAEGQGAGGAGGSFQVSTADPGVSTDGLGLRAFTPVSSYSDGYGTSRYGAGGWVTRFVTQGETGKWPAGGGGGGGGGYSSAGAAGAGFVRLTPAPGATMTILGTPVGDPLLTTLAGKNTTPGLMTFYRNGTCVTTDYDQPLIYIPGYTLYFVNPIQKSTFPWIVDSLTGLNPSGSLGDEFFISITRTVGTNNFTVHPSVGQQTAVNGAGETCYRMNMPLGLQVLSTPGQVAGVLNMTYPTFVARVYHQSNLNAILATRTISSSFLIIL